MPPRKLIVAQTLIDATCASVKAISILKIQEKFDFSQRAARHVAAAANLTKEDYLNGVRENLMSALGQASERLSHEMDTLSTAQLPVVCGILTDKVQHLTDNQTPNTQVLIQVNGESNTKDQILNGLFGKVVRSDDGPSKGAKE